MAKNKIPIKIVKLNSSMFQLTKIPSTIINKAAEKFSYLPPGYRFQPKFRLMGVKGVKVRLVQPDGSFPAGLFYDVYEYLTNELGKKVKLSKDVKEHFFPLIDFFEDGINDDVFGEFEFEPGSPVKLRDYQLDSVKKGFEKRYGLLNLSTGAGKCLGGDTNLTVRMPTEIAEKYGLIQKRKK